jgi:hypothetical protein
VKPNNLILSYLIRSEGRSEAGDQRAMARRIELGDVLAEHLVELRGRAVSGRR